MPGYEPDPKLKFTFGLWTVGNIGRDPFGEPTRSKISTVQICQLLGEVGAYGVNFHDNDAIPIESTPEQAKQIVKEFKKSLKENGLVCPMATANLFSDPVFKDGAFTSNNSADRAYAIQKTMCAMEAGAELGAKYRSTGAGAKGLNRMPPKARSTRSNAFASASTSWASGAFRRSSITGSRSKPSRTSRAGTCILRSPDHIWP